MSTGLMERLEVSLDRDWLVAQIEKVKIDELYLTLQQGILAGACLGRFDHQAWSIEEAAFLKGWTLEGAKNIVTTALEHCVQQAPNEDVRAELNRIGNWLFPTE